MNEFNKEFTFNDIIIKQNCTLCGVKRSKMTDYYNCFFIDVVCTFSKEKIKLLVTYTVCLI